MGLITEDWSNGLYSKKLTVLRTTVTQTEPADDLAVVEQVPQGILYFYMPTATDSNQIASALRAFSYLREKFSMNQIAGGAGNAQIFQAYEITQR